MVSLNLIVMEEDQARMDKLVLLMVTHTAVALDQAMDHRQAMDKLDLRMPPIQDLMDRPPNQSCMVVDQATGKLKDTVDQATGTGKLKDTADQDTMEGMENIKIGMVDTVVWRRIQRWVQQKTKRKPLKLHEAWRPMRRKMHSLKFLRSRR